MYLIYKKFIQKTSLSSNQTTSVKQTTSANQLILSSSSSTNQVNLVQNALTATKVKQININENFTNGNTIIFDTNEVINQNFNLFLNTYFPPIDIVRINESLIKTQNMTMQEIINKKIKNDPTFNSLSLIKLTNYGFKNYLAYVIELTDPTLFILFSLWMLLIRNINDNKCDYYFNDYEKEKDFIVYSGPCLSNDEMKIKYNEMKDTIPSDGYNLDYTIINKTSWRKGLRQSLINYSFTVYTTSSTITPITIFEDKFIDLFNELSMPVLSTTSIRSDQFKES